MSSPTIGSPRSSKRRAQSAVRGDEDRDAVDEGAAGRERLLGVELGRPLRADRQVGDQDLGAATRAAPRPRRPAAPPPPRSRRPCSGRCRRASARAARVTPRPAASAKRKVLFGAREDRLADVAPDLAGVDVEGRGHLDVADVVAAELDVHQPGRRLVGGRLGVVAEPLHERARRSCPTPTIPTRTLLRAMRSSCAGPAPASGRRWTSRQREESSLPAPAVSAAELS